MNHRTQPSDDYHINYISVMMKIAIKMRKCKRKKLEIPNDIKSANYKFREELTSFRIMKETRKPDHDRK